MFAVKKKLISFAVMTTGRIVPSYLKRIFFNYLLLTKISTFMKKNLFLTCVLALASFVGVSAQDWYHTVVNGLPGTDVTTKLEDGTEVTNKRAETQVFNHAGTKKVRMTVLQTGSTNQIKGGGPTWNLAELKIYDGAGLEVAYTATSNADHNTMGGAGNDGAGLPALNDGNLNNYWHSTWSAAAPNEFHYLELELEKAVDAFKLVWWNRPNNNNNCPVVVGLSVGGKQFTEDMLFAEYNYSLGNEVSDVAAFADPSKFFTLYVEGPAEFTRGETTTEGRGNVYVALSGYDVGSSTEATPMNIVQVVKSREGKYVIYQPVLGSYYCDPNRWTDGYNGSNGWFRASNEAQRLDELELTKREDGDWEITTEIYRQYVDGAWQDYDTPVKVWVGYDMRGSLKLFPQAEKEKLEAEDYETGKFHLPVDFGFTIYEANVADGLIAPITVEGICNEFVTPAINEAREKLETYAEYEEFDWDEPTAKRVLETALEEAEAAVAAADLVAIIAAKDNITAALKAYILIKNNYYEEEAYVLQDEYNANCAGGEGSYTANSQAIIDNITTIVEALRGDYMNQTVGYIEGEYTKIEALIEQFYASKLHYETFPYIVEEIAADNFPYSELPNNAVWKQNVALEEAVTGIRLTFLDRHIGSAGDPGNFPMIAIGEFKLYDANGDEVELTESNFEANYTETQEGFESTVARLCDGNFAAQGYYHSPWSGSEPQEYIWIDVEFPTAMDVFSFEVYSRDKSTSQDKVSLFPKKTAITAVDVVYDPLLTEPNPYNVQVGAKVTSLDQIKADGYYVLKGLLNTSEYYGNGNGLAKFYKGATERFHNSPAAVRAESIYRIKPNGDGTYTFFSLYESKYWGETEGTAGERNGYIKRVVAADEAAKLKIVPAENTEFENSFVFYDEVAGLTTDGDSIDTDADEVNDAVDAVYNTPYVVYMDWAAGVASRPVINPQPRGGVDNSIDDAKGDSLCFNKGNGEGQWEIYEATIENPDYFWLTGMMSVFNENIVLGNDPGCVAELGTMEAPYKKALEVIEDSLYTEATAAANALFAELNNLENLNAVPMSEGKYVVLNADKAFYEKQGKNKALYATADMSTFGWKDAPTELDNVSLEFVFDFKKATYNDDKLTEEEAAQVYTIRAVGVEGTEPIYVGALDEKSKAIDLSDVSAKYAVINVRANVFNLANPANKAEFCIHANGHGSGANASGNIVYWDGSAGASQWTLKKVDVETSVSDIVVEGDEVVSVSYYTPAGAAIPAPVKGANIVVVVYSNGVVETKKVMVK